MNLNRKMENNKKRRFWQLDNPNNARIFIDYKNDKNPVKFEYIQTNRLFHIIFSPIFLIWLWINLLFLTFNFFLFAILYLILNGISITQISSNFDFTSFFYGILILFWIYGIPLIISLFFIKSKKLIRLMPYINSLCSFKTRYFKVFKSKDVIDNKVEIPLFYNVNLNYKATKDFSKYLEKFEIIEHPFNMDVKRKIFSLKKEVKPNEYLWKATFYFSKKPKTGELKVSFK